MVFVLPHPHFDWTSNTHPRFLFPAKLSEYHAGVIGHYDRTGFSRFQGKQVGKPMSAISRYG
jgi:hypothetical protein